MPLLQHATFVTSATAAPHLPVDSELEVAVAGRSNAGKSRAINALAGRRRLAFVSKTPGRTQEINYFRIVDGKYLVDLPGYGYAKVPTQIKKRWEAFLGEFLLLRPQLAGQIVIMDARHPVTELDLRLLDWFSPTGKPVHVLLTKIGASRLKRYALPRSRAGVARTGATTGISTLRSLRSATRPSSRPCSPTSSATWRGSAPSLPPGRRTRR